MSVMLANVALHRYRGGELNGTEIVKKAASLGAQGLVVYTGPPDGMQNSVLLATLPRSPTGAPGTSGRS